MARKKKRFKSSEIVEGDLTPMIDMTFQLIAFFMLLINFSEVDRAEEISLPKSALAVRPEERPDYQIILNVVPQTEGMEPGQRYKFAGKAYTIEDLETIFLKEKNAAAREQVKPGDIAVIIRAHEKVATGAVQKLISACQKNELQSFSLRVSEKVRGAQ